MKEMVKMWFDKCRQCGKEIQRGVYAVAQLAMGNTLEFKCAGCDELNIVYPDMPPIIRDKAVETQQR